VGEGVTEVKTGDRVAYAALPPGAYAKVRVIPAHRLVRLPESIPFRQAAGMMLRGMTARYLLYGCTKVKRGDTLLVQAAAGGVGLILSQWAKFLGATVIGTVGSRRKPNWREPMGAITRSSTGRKTLPRGSGKLQGTRR